MLYKFTFLLVFQKGKNSHFSFNKNKKESMQIVVLIIFEYIVYI
jgi:hypothetical protein